MSTSSAHTVGRPTTSPVSAIASTTSATTAPGRSTTDGGFVLDFAGISDRSLAGFRGPGGRVFDLQFNYDGTGLAVRGGRMVRAHPTAQGAPILMVPNPRAPVSVSAAFTFLPGRPASENVVLGTCATAFRDSSVQLAVWSDHWRLLFTLYSATRGRTVVTELAGGTLPRAVPTDGHTATTASLTRTGSERVEVRLPGVDRTITAPAIGTYWGSQFGIQIRHPAGTGGDAAVVTIADRLG